MARKRRLGQDGLGRNGQRHCPEGGPMAGRWRRIAVTTASAGLVLPGAGLAARGDASPAASYGSVHCSAGAHTPPPPASPLSPDTGNGRGPTPPPHPPPR